MTKQPAGMPRLVVICTYIYYNVLWTMGDENPTLLCVPIYTQRPARKQERNQHRIRYEAKHHPRASSVAAPLLHGSSQAKPRLAATTTRTALPPRHPQAKQHASARCTPHGPVVAGSSLFVYAIPRPQRRPGQSRRPASPTPRVHPWLHGQRVQLQKLPGPRPQSHHPHPCRNPHCPYQDLPSISITECSRNGP